MNAPKRLRSLVSLINNDVDSLMYGQKLLTEMPEDDDIIKAASQESILSSEPRVNTECDEIVVIDDSDDNNKKDEREESEKKLNKTESGDFQSTVRAKLMPSN